MQAYVPPKLRQIVAEAVFRRGTVVLTTFFLVFGTVCLATMLMHKRYEAKAKLLVQNVRTAAQLTTSSVDHLVSQGDISPAEINTEVDLLESDGVASRALATDGSKYAPEYRSKYLQRFHRQLTVEAVHQTDVINLAMLGSSPEAAERALQSLIDAYFEERAGTARNSGAAEFFSAQLQGKSRQLDADQAALTAFEMQHGIADLDDQTKLQVSRLSTLQDELARIQSLLAAQQDKVAAERQELASTPPRSQTQVRTITNQYSQERLNTSLVELRNRRSELLQRYVPTDRQILEIDDKIATTRKAINEASDHPAGEESTDANPLWVQLSTQIATAGSEVNGLLGQKGELEIQIREAGQRLRDLEASTAGYNDLRRKLQQSQADYALYAQRRDEARISEALDRQKLFNVAVLQGPFASTEAVRPKPILYMTTAAVLGLLLGVFFAVYADLAGGEVHTPSQLDAWTGVRTLATFADEEQGSWTVEANRRQYSRVLFGLRQAVYAWRALPPQTGPAAVVPARTPPLPSPSSAEDLGLCIAFTSALQREGVSFLVRHLAAEAGRQASQRIAVLDARDLLERSQVQKAGKLALQFEAQGDHWVLAAPEKSLKAREGTGTEPRGGSTTQLTSALQRARSEFDVVLLDCPSLQTSMLAGELSSSIDGYVAVVKAGAARKQNVEDLTFHLASTSAPMLGYVLTKRSYPVPRWLHKLI